MPMDYLSTRGYYGQDPVGTRLREIVQGRLGGSQMRAQSLAAGQQAHGIAQANTANPALAARQAAQATATSGAQIADAEARQRMAAQSQALQLIEARRRESQQFAQRMLGGAIGAGASLLGMVVPGLGGAASGAANTLGLPSTPFGRPGPQTDAEVAAQPGVQGLRQTRQDRFPELNPNATAGQVMDQAGVAPMPGPAPITAPNAPPPSVAETSLAQGVPAPNYAPQVPQSAMPAERQGQPAPGAGQGGNMMRPVESTLLSTGMPGRYIPGGDPLAEGAPPQEQAPALNPMAARLAGMAPVQGALSPGQLAPPVPASPSDQFMMLLQQSAFPYLDNLDPGAGSRPLRYLRSQ